MTSDEVALLIPQYEWVIMDEEQKDELMSKLVLPHYMEMMDDGVKLTPTWWAEKLGASPAAIKNRVQRLKASQNDGSDSVPTWPKNKERAAAQVAREEPEQLVAKLTPTELDALAAAAHQAQMKNIREANEQATESLDDAAYDEIRDGITEIEDRSTIELDELFTALSRVRVKGIERLVANASAGERRSWAERLPEEIAMLQLIIDLCKTRKLEAVNG
jgi:hypothetical protein